MEMLKGIALLLLVLSIFSLFSLKMPKGMKAMGALANAAVATFLVEAFQRYVGGDLIGIEFLGKVGDSSGSMGGVAAATLVALALGVSPVYAMLIGAAVLGYGIIPGFVAGYVLAFVVPKIEKKIPAGLDLIVCLLFVAPAARGIALLADPVVNQTLLNIGSVITAATTKSPMVMAIVLGGVITVVATAPLSSMALTAMLGLTGVPMAIGALAVMGSSFLNPVLFHRLKLGKKETVIAVAIEPLTQADVISVNPIPVFVTNFIGGALAGLVVVHFGLINNAVGTATPIAGLAVMFGFNPAITVIKAAVLCAAAGAFSGFLGSVIFKNYKIIPADVVRGTK